MAYSDPTPRPGRRSPNRTHGMTRTRTHNVWCNMIARCHKPYHTEFHRYGARGIHVCNRWRESFEAFFADMGECPAGHSIERKDNNAHYEPGNCVWATAAEQAKNRRTTRLITHDGLTLCLKDWAKRIGVPRNTLYNRLRLGWSFAEAIAVPQRGRGYSR